MVVAFSAESAAHVAATAAGAGVKEAEQKAAREAEEHSRKEAEEQAKKEAEGQEEAQRREGRGTENVEFRPLS